MQFSIGGVPFKCTKDMFIWEKIKWTICVYWAHLWRGMILGLVFLIGMGVAFFQSDLFQALLSVSEEQEREQIFADWFRAADISLLLGVWAPIILGVLIVYIYINYFTLVKKNYKSFDKLPVANSFPYTFWSGSYWGRFLLSVLYVLIITLVLIIVTTLAFLLGALVVILIGLIPGGTAAAAIVGLILLVLGYAVYTIAGILLPTHILLHGGTWGFVPINKQLAPLEKTVD